MRYIFIPWLTLVLPLPSTETFHTKFIKTLDFDSRISRMSMEKQAPTWILILPKFGIWYPCIGLWNMHFSCILPLKSNSRFTECIIHIVLVLLCRFATLPPTAALFKKPELSDLKLKVGDNHFYAHRLIMCAGSEVFHRMLGSSKWAEAKLQELELQEEEECVKVSPP